VKGLARGPIARAEVGEFIASGADAGLVADHREDHVGGGVSEALGFFEDGEFFAGALGIFEEVDAVVRFVGAGDEEVEIAVGVPIERHGPGPEANAEIDGEAGVLILNAIEGEKGPGGKQKKDDERLHVAEGFRSGVG
jgi:hypothetical protein